MDRQVKFVNRDLFNVNPPQTYIVGKLSRMWLSRLLILLYLPP